MNYFYSFWLNMYVQIKNDLVAFLAGVISFFIIIGFLQYLMKFFRVLSHTKFANFFGFIIFTISSTISLIFILKINDCKINFKVYLSEKSLFTLKISYILSLITFLTLAENFSCLLASSLLYPGAFAKKSVEISDHIKQITITQRKQIQVLGKTFGCHSCGKLYRIPMLSKT